jgi:hypothetical protein
MRNAFLNNLRIRELSLFFFEFKTSHPVIQQSIHPSSCGMTLIPFQSFDYVLDLLDVEMAEFMENCEFR